MRCSLGRAWGGRPHYSKKNMRQILNCSTIMYCKLFISPDSQARESGHVMMWDKFNTYNGHWVWGRASELSCRPCSHFHSTTILGGEHYSANVACLVCDWLPWQWNHVSSLYCARALVRGRPWPAGCRVWPAAADHAYAHERACTILVGVLPGPITVAICTLEWRLRYVFGELLVVLLNVGNGR